MTLRYRKHSAVVLSFSCHPRQREMAAIVISWLNGEAAFDQYSMSRRPRQLKSVGAALNMSRYLRRRGMACRLPARASSAKSKSIKMRLASGRGNRLRIARNSTRNGGRGDMP